MSGGYFFDAGRADVSEAWVSYICDAPIFVYASVIDTGSGDQTFIPAVDDRGPNALPTRTHELDVTLEDFSITISPAPAGIRQGDTIVFHVRVKNGSHSFELFSPTPNRVILPTPPGAAADVSFIAEGEGVYIYSCANPDCGAGHVNMSGTIVVRNSDPDH
jgi:heme/copper-type cytochrome/quinol oxidase subunit 2